MTKQMIRVKWDDNDARFLDYDEEIFETVELAKSAIQTSALAKNYSTYESIDGKTTDIFSKGEVSYKDWVNWCIDSFCYFEPVTVHLEKVLTNSEK